MGKGTRKERQLFLSLWKNGFAVIRSPASGSGRKHPQPDILASGNGSTYGIETKSTGKDRVYINKKEVLKLASFCKRWGNCEPLIGIRFDYEDWLFVSPKDMLTTKKSFKVNKKRAKERGIDLEDL